MYEMNFWCSKLLIKHKLNGDMHHVGIIMALKLDFDTGP